ncbi:MAG TPA: glycosyltransferase family 2 protein [Longimicrobiaceae bacterium]|nr:glycosyltransferase family 2 protein [Longimicrobiaceae bacterium]
MSGVAAVVVNHNTRAHLRACLASLPRGLPAVVVDNASTDGSPEMVRAEFPEALLLADGTNPGYGAAANRGVRACAAEHVLVLNSDTRLEPGAPEALRAYLDAHPRAAVAGPRLLNPDGSPQASCFPFPGTLAWFLENDPVAPLAARVPGLRDRLLCASPPRRATAVPWVLGAALAVRRSAFEAVGGFDEGYFMYFEEVDLCRRLASAGWETHFVPEARVAHVGAASTSQVRASMAVQHFRSTLRFYRRHYRGPRLAFWLGTMRAKMLFRLLRDGAASRVARSGRRGALREDAAAWRRAILETGR